MKVELKALFHLNVYTQTKKVMAGNELTQIKTNTIYLFAHCQDSAGAKNVLTVGINHQDQMILLNDLKN